MIPGCDTSFWQDDNDTLAKPDFNKMASHGEKFVFIRATYGKLEDEDFKTSWRDAKAAGLMRGAYLYMTTNHAPMDQVNMFLSLTKDDPGELPPVVDFEEKGSNPSNLLIILNEIEKQFGVVPIIYTGYYIWKDNANTKPMWARYPLWIAAYVQTPRVPLPWTNWTFWQYTDRGDGRGHGMESAGLDMDWFNGDMDALLKFATRPIAQPVLTIEQRVANLETWAKGLGYR